MSDRVDAAVSWPDARPDICLAVPRIQLNTTSAAERITRPTGR
jgi:hypothetical protein